jgi:choline dehydrogenase-like flavoprotein
MSTAGWRSRGYEGTKRGARPKRQAIMTDYIIVGGGPAGCVLANRLSADPSVRVLLLEAGGKDRHPLFHMPAGFAKMTKGIASWGWSTLPQKHLAGRVLWYTQAKVIGGGSSINAQVYTRGNRRDYDDWAAAGARGWSYAEVLPYFKRAEDNQRFVDLYHAYGGPIGVSSPVNPLPLSEAFLRAAQELGIPYNPDFNGAQQAGIGHYQVTVRNARRSSASVAYLKPIRGRSNLTVKTGAIVRQIVIEHGRAVGVEAGEPDGSWTTLRAEHEILVTAGAIGSPRLLMLSGIGPADHLREVGISVAHDLPGVGSNLQDHLDLYALAECTGHHSYDAYSQLHRTIWAGIEYILFARGPAASTLFETGGFWYADRGGKSQEGRPDIQFHLGLGSGIEAGVERLKNGGVTVNSAYVRPKSRGSVRLPNADIGSMPLIDPNYFAEPEDRAMALAGLRLAREILRQPALKTFIAAERKPGPELKRDEDLLQYVYASCKTDHHPCGTCAMGTDEMAVVGPDLKLRGIEGLRVCDSSVMPRIPSSNTNAPTIMVAEKAADHIRGGPMLAHLDGGSVA